MQSQNVSEADTQNSRSGRGRPPPASTPSKTKGRACAEVLGRRHQFYAWVSSVTIVPVLRNDR